MIVTQANIEEVGKNLQAMLEGKTFTFTQHNPAWSKPRVERGQYLTESTSGPPIVVYHYEGYSFLVICDSYGVWNISTKAEVTFHPKGLYVTFVAGSGDTVTYSIEVEGPIPEEQP